MAALSFPMAENLALACCDLKPYRRRQYHTQSHMSFWTAVNGADHGQSRIFMSLYEFSER